MNQVIQETIRRLSPRFQPQSDGNLIQLIQSGREADDALFYLLFGRYEEMLLAIFRQKAKPSVAFDDFMLELHLKLFTNRQAAIAAFDERKASFKTYLSRIASNLLFDLNEKDWPTLEVDEVTLQEHATGVDPFEMFALIDAINTYPNKDSRYVLLKTIEGYKSREIAAMLTSSRHEEGTLAAEESLKASYIDTLRSRALKDIRRRLEPSGCCIRESLSAATPESNIRNVRRFMLTEDAAPMPCLPIQSAAPVSNFYLDNLCALYQEMKHTF